MIDAVYVSNRHRALLFQYVSDRTAPAYSAVASVQSVDALVLIPEQFSPLPRHVATTGLGSILISVVVTSVANPALPTAFLRSVASVMLSFLGDPISSAKIERSSDILSLLMNEMIVDGMPYITDVNQLHQLVSRHTLRSKLLPTAADLAPPPVQDLKLPYQWRRPNVRYTNNEMFVDVYEEVNMVYQCAHDPAGVGVERLGLAFYSLARGLTARQTRLVPISGHLSGKIDFVLHLGGLPQLQIILNQQGRHALGVPSFHRCVDVGEWTRHQHLNFVPPDGNMTLAQYCVDADSSTAFSLPVDVSVYHGLGPHRNEFELVLHLSRALETCTITIETESAESPIKLVRSTHGDFSTASAGRAEWKLRSIGANTIPTLAGQIISSSSTTNSSTLDTPARLYTIHVSYMHKGSVPSGLRIELVKLISAKGMGSTVKPYKGVKYETRTSDVVIRV